MVQGLALFPVASAADDDRQRQARNAETQQSQYIVGLASHARKRWTEAREAKSDLEDRMLKCMRQRNGDYDPEVRQMIREQGGSDIYIQLTSVKCRAATSWLRDTLLGSGADKPWSIENSPIPDLPNDILESLQAELAQEIMTAYQATGQMPSEEQMRREAQYMKDRAMEQLREEAQQRVSRMERKMEDQLIEGGWYKAFNEFIDDIVTFPFAAIKGPIKRKRKVLQWSPEGQELVTEEIIRNEWERVDPFHIYWAPWASDINDGYVIERHRLTRTDLQALIGVPGYDEDAIRTVLSEHTGGTLGEWLWSDTAKSEAEGKDVTAVQHTTDLIDALQLWDSVPGSLLLEWGVSEEEIQDKDLDYPCEVWLIGQTVIRAVLNYDPLGRKPYYLTSYEAKPGSVDGKGVADLCRDTQMMMNAAARALANNMGIASGPQVGVNVSRLPAGEDITQMYPWKIWQFQSAEFNDGSQPLSFFQPSSNANELMAVFEKFSSRADEDTMIPKYMTGGHQPGASRTSSGLSMLISNAGKGIKQVISNIDKNVIIPAIQRLYHDNIRYAEDMDMVGDVNINARGASSLVVKEAEALRRNEFLQLVLNSPTAQQIVGMDGTAELLRDAAGNLSQNPDRIVPDRAKLSQIQQMAGVIEQLQQQLSQVMGTAQPNGQAGPQPQLPQNNLPDGSPMGGRQNNLVSPRPNGA